MWRETDQAKHKTKQNTQNVLMVQLRVEMNQKKLPVEVDCD